MSSAAAGTGYLRASVFVAGAAVMAAEMAAPRLLAPSFGTTQIVWTNIIGTVLLALTLGAFVGGRLADRWPSERAYARVLILAGVLLAAVPLASRPFLSRAVEAMLGQQAGTFLLSLAAVCLFFAPPVFLLGMIAPWAVRLAGSGRPDLGRVAGVLSGLSASGSILGTFLASLVALPLLGTQTTLLAVSGLLIATGFWRTAGSLPGRVLRVGGVAALGLLLVGFARVAERPAGELWAGESLYQRVRVVQEGGWTRLLLNEPVGDHSLRPSEGRLTGGVWDFFAALPAFLPREDGALRVLVLGLAAGTAADQIDHYWADRHALAIDGVEIDPTVVEMGRRFFALGEVATLSVHVADARAFLETASGRYDVIIADAYKGSYVPFQMATREFYASCLERLAPGGVFALNLATLPEAGALLDAFTATLRAVFPHVARFDVGSEDVSFVNFVYLGSREPLAPPAAGRLPAELAAHVLPTMRQTWQAPRAPAGAWLLTDDRAPVELLTDAMLLELVAR